VGSNSVLQYVDYGIAYSPGFEDMRRRVPDVTKLRRLTGFVPSTPIAETIRQILDHLDAPPSSMPSDAPRRPAVRAAEQPGTRNSIGSV
jgi:UDP-glucose 4-epimerase